MRLCRAELFQLHPAISIHAPRAGCDDSETGGLYKTSLFQSTHPVRGATITSTGVLARQGHFNPRTPCGVRRILVASVLNLIIFQSTHPVRGATAKRLLAWLKQWLFQSTHPVRGATGAVVHIFAEVRISIHAPRAGCDSQPMESLTGLSCDFNPRTPCGVRL